MMYTLTWEIVEKIAGLEAAAHRCLIRPAPLNGTYVKPADLVVLKRALKELLDNSLLRAINEDTETPIKSTENDSYCNHCGAMWPDEDTPCPNCGRPPIASIAEGN